MTHPLPVSSGHGKQVAHDIVGPPATMPQSSRFDISSSEATFTRNRTTETVIDFLITIFSPKGYSEVIVTGHGPQFGAHDFKKLSSDLGIARRQSAIFHP